jgi:hypothetical protein
MRRHGLYVARPRRARPIDDVHPLAGSQARDSRGVMEIGF